MNPSEILNALTKYAQRSFFYFGLLVLVLSVYVHYRNEKFN